MYIYTNSQYFNLVTTTIIASAISIIFSVFILIAYVFLRVSKPYNSRRLSLRCVFIASITNSINAIFDIISVLRFGDDAFCRSSLIIKQFTRVLSSSLLMIVGINLVIVFVLNIKTTFKFELGYFALAVVYSFITISIPLREAINKPLAPDSPYRCWYHVNFYEMYGHSHVLWMWFYGFLFLTVFIATCCSITSMLKLIREYRLLMGRFVSIAATSEIQESAESQIQDRKKNQSNIFIKVIYRCIIYPLVPLISNIWGFIFQIILLRPQSLPDYGLSVIDTTFGCLQGFFLAIVFFSDPTMTSFIREKLALWKTVYVDEYTEVYVYVDGHVEIASKDNFKSSRDISLSKSMSIQYDHLKSKRKFSSLPILPIYSPSDIDTTCHGSSITLPSPLILTDHHQPQDIEITGEEKYNLLSNPISKVPMRQMSIPSSNYSRQSQTINVRSASLINNYDGNNHLQYTPTFSDDAATRIPSRTLVDSDIPNKVFKSYKYPRLAKFTHWALAKFYKSKPIELSYSDEQKPFLPVHPLHIN